MSSGLLHDDIVLQLTIQLRAVTAHSQQMLLLLLLVMVLFC